MPASAPSTMPASGPASLPASAPTKEETTAPIEAAKEAFFAPGQLVSFLPFSLRRAAFSFQYERPIVSQRYSLAAGLGMRFGAKDPDRSLGVTLGAEGKRWIGQRPQFGESGFYLMGRLDLAENRLHDADGLVGASMTLEENFGPGFRLVIAKKVELSLAGSIGIRSEFEHRSILPPLHSGTVALWSSLGWFF